MQDPANIDLDQLRELFLSAPESGATRLVAVAVSLCVLVVVLWMVRRRTLREEYTPIWVVVAVGMTIVSLRMDLLLVVTRLTGAWTLSSTILFCGELFLIGLCLNYAVRLSRYGTHLKRLAQETAILRAKLEQLGAGAEPR